AFNVLDSRGAVSTADRAAEFARMRRLAGDVARLWVGRREELGHPLGVVTPRPPAAAFEAAPQDAAPRTLVFEIGTEEMPPAEARAARAQVLRELTERLAGTRLAHGDVRVHATPRRLIAVVGEVAAREDDHVRTVKGPKATAPQQAVAGFARSQGVAVESLRTADLGGVPHLVVERHEAGRAAPAVLGEVLAKVAGGLRSARNMRWNDPSLAFTRPIRWLVALWGDEIVPVAVSALLAGRETRVLRPAERPQVSVASAETFMETLAINGVVADAEDRRELIVTGAQDLVWDTGRIDVAGESALIDQITYLVEQPTPLLGTFDERYLELPAAVLTTVMRKHQRYLPVRDADGALLPMFVTVANGQVDVELVRAGNEAVLRARYEDAAFFYRADRQTPPAAMRERLRRLTFTDKLGSMADRADRIAALATTLAGEPSPTLRRAAELVKFDLGSQLVTEMTSLAGVMARDYALNAGETPAVARAVYEAELPRHAGDDLPAGVPGALLSLADRLDLVAGLAATVGLPTGSSDPFAVRRAVLGLLAVHRAHPDLSGISLTESLAAAAALQPVEVPAGVLADAGAFLAGRLEQVLVEEGHQVDRVRAVLPHAGRPSFADLLLAQLGRLIADPEFLALAEAIQRARRIVPDGTAAAYDPAALREPAELTLHEAVLAARAELEPATDLTRFTAAAARITGPVNAFFDDVFVMADDPAVRAARLGLLACVRDLGADLLDWPQLRL
ncbi:glycine--tRNA ligase subunit beta, partial [Actinoplanes sp. NPDC026623]|uniref:glycine--tRNA ligase subunit beta n=1 Tax=Actinoplanes sp. NPDC026623 TaxID=3155610 RepID=UPI0033D8B528